MFERVTVEEPMLVKLRRKLVVTNVAFAALVLLTVGATVLYADYHQQMKAVDASLERSLAMEEANPPIDAGPSPEQAPQDGLSGELQGDRTHLDGSSAQLDSADDAVAGGGELSSGLWIVEREEPENRGWLSTPPERRGNDLFVATSVYEVSPECVAIARVDALSLDSEITKNALGIVLSESLQANGQDVIEGSIPSLNLYYRATVQDDGSMKVAFASASSVWKPFFSLLRTICLASLGALACFLAISLVLARWSVRPVARAWNQQQRFVADASHELKTPLAVILANNSILMSDPQATVSSQMKWVESTENEAQLMQNLVNDMLYLAQTENMRSEEKVLAVDFSDIVRGTVLQFESVAFERNVLISEEIAPGIQVKGDPERLRRLVRTLVDNACKYTDERGSVDVRLRRSGQNCCLRVSNTGTVIPAEDLPHLFDRFYRSDKSRTREAGGFGLGLSIAKGVVEELGGSINVTSAESEGTSFDVELPMA